MPIAGQGRTQAAPNCFIHTLIIDGKQTAGRVVGRIYRQDTGGRENPPPCLSDFGCGGTPFALGHLMALELGGCDISANIVPQYGQWQGNAAGAWRRMEVGVKNATADADVFLAEIAYQAAPFPETYEVQYDRFSNGEKLFHWKEPRIPAQFRVWTVSLGWSGGGFSVARYFSADNNGKDAMIGGLIAALPETRRVLNETIGAMPQIDRDYWRGQMINAFVRTEHFKYQRSLKTRYQADQALYEKKLEEFQKKTGVQRTSRRISPKNLGAPIAPKEPVPVSMATWLQNDEVAQKLVNRLKDTDNPPGAVTGWREDEIGGMSIDKLRYAIYV